MLRRIAPLAIAVSAFALFAGPPADAAEVEYDNLFASAYVWRGLSVVDGPVFQPSITISHESGFSFNTWGNFDLDNSNTNSGDFSEIDLTPSYSFDTDSIVGVDVGVIFYLFPNSKSGTEDSTTEVYAGLTFDVPASPFITIYYDYDQVDDYYVSFGFGFDGEFTEELGWEAAATGAYAGQDFSTFYAGGTESGFFDYNLSFAVGYTVNDNFGIGAFVAWADSMDSQVLPEQMVDFYGGISFTGSF
jgi:uncharacterized protein (TIGR02001 family)